MDDPPMNVLVKWVNSIPQSQFVYKVNYLPNYYNSYYEPEGDINHEAVFTAEWANLDNMTIKIWRYKNNVIIIPDNPEIKTI